MKIRLTSLFLATVIAISATGCSIKDSSKFESMTESGYEQVIDQNDLQSRMINFIEVIENSDMGIDLSSFYNNAKTLQIIMDQEKDIHYTSFYDKDKNIIVVNINETGAFEHELVHVIFNNGKELGNVFLEEGFTELLTNEVCGSPSSYRFNVGVCKIFTTLLGRDKMIEVFNNKDLSIITEGLAGIVPKVSDAAEFMEYANYEHSLCNKMHETYFTEGSFDEFKNSNEFTSLKNVRRDLVGRLKIYIKSYYSDLVRQDGIDVEKTLMEMLAMLDVVNKDLFDIDIESEPQNDFFLKEEVSYLVNTYGIDDSTYDKCYQESKSMNYLFVSDGTTKVKEK